MSPARYQDIPAAAIPSYAGADGVTVKAVAGVFARDGERIEGPVRGVSTTPIFFDVHLPADGRVQQAIPAAHNSFVYVYEGSLVAAEGTSLTQGLGAKQGGVFAPGGESLVLQAGPAGCRCLLLSATPIGEPIAQYGPFVMNTREEIEQAVRDYQSGRLTA
jgi:redox-sensitive bicupin YhaK (pirin superfamily)